MQQVIQVLLEYQLEIQEYQLMNYKKTKEKNKYRQKRNLYFFLLCIFCFI
jgi:hypothetical protein